MKKQLQAFYCFLFRPFDRFEDVSCVVNRIKPYFLQKCKKNPDFIALIPAMFPCVEFIYKVLLNGTYIYRFNGKYFLSDSRIGK